MMGVLRMKGNPIGDKQLVIPKERNVYWERIKIHAAAYLESEQMFSKEAGV